MNANNLIYPFSFVDHFVEEEEITSSLNCSRVDLKITKQIMMEERKAKRRLNPLRCAQIGLKTTARGLSADRSSLQLTSLFPFDKSETDCIVPTENKDVISPLETASHISHQKVETVLQRKYPPISLHDTSVNPSSYMTTRSSIYGRTHVFLDEEIVKEHPIVRTQFIEEGDYKIQVLYTENEKSILQQQATRGCTAATSAMLILDHKGIPNISSFKSRNLGDFEQQREDIEKAGLKTKITIISKDLCLLDQFEELKKLINQDGSAIVSIIDETMGGHVIIIDEIYPHLDQARIRDPYHAWEITVTKESLLKRFNLGIQIVLQVTSLVEVNL